MHLAGCCDAPDILVALSPPPVCSAYGTLPRPLPPSPSTLRNSLTALGNNDVGDIHAPKKRGQRSEYLVMHLKLKMLDEKK